VRIGTGSGRKAGRFPLIGLPYVVLARKRHQASRGSQGKKYRRDSARRFSLSPCQGIPQKAQSKRKGSYSSPPSAARRRSATRRLCKTCFSDANSAPLDARGKKDGFNVIYNLNDLGLPFIYSSLFVSGKTWKERPAVCKKWWRRWRSRILRRKESGPGDGFSR